MSSDRQEQVIYGIHAAGTRLASGIGLIRLRIKTGRLNKRLEELLLLGARVGCPIERGEVHSYTGVAHQGVALYVEPPVPVPDLTTLLGNKPADLLLLVLDGVTDPRNLGACLRSAGSMAVDAVIVPKNHSAPLNEAAIKTASGAADLVPFIQAVNLGRVLDTLKESGVWTVGTTPDAGTAIQDLDLTGNIALVMGAEDKGMRHKTRAKCDFLARVPMTHAEPGLNVSVATGICLYEARRQRNARQVT